MQPSKNYTLYTVVTVVISGHTSGRSAASCVSMSAKLKLDCAACTSAEKRCHEGYSQEVLLMHVRCGPPAQISQSACSVGEGTPA